MKKTIVILLLLLIPLVSASVTKEFDDLNFNDTVVVYGKTLTIVSVSGSKVRVNVDGVHGNVQPGRQIINVNGMHIRVLKFDYFKPDYLETKLRITVHSECGDGKCEDMETSKMCCKDCGCEENSVCIDNICYKHACAVNEDCKDTNLCTVDKCSNTTIKTCSNTIITKCKSGDDCCPEACNPTNDDECMRISEELDKVLLEAKKKALLEALDDVNKRLKELESKEEPLKEPLKEPPKEPPKEQEQPPPEEPAKEGGITLGGDMGIFIMIGVALLVSIIGFFLLGRK